MLSSSTLGSGNEDGAGATAALALLSDATGLGSAYGDARCSISLWKGRYGRNLSLGQRERRRA